MPATAGLSVTGNMQTPQGAVRYIRVPAGMTRATYNLKSTPLNNVTASTTPVTVVATPVAAGRGRGNSQAVAVKQGPPTPGVATPKTTSTTTIVRRGKGRGKKTSTINVLDTTPEIE